MARATHAGYQIKTFADGSLFRARVHRTDGALIEAAGIIRRAARAVRFSFELYFFQQRLQSKRQFPSWARQAVPP